MIVAGLSLAMLNLVWLATPADAGTEDRASHVNALVDRTRELVERDGTAYARSEAPPVALAVGDCGEASVSDVDEGGYLDIELAAAFANCDGTLSAGVLTYDAWDNSELSAFVIDIDIDRNPSTGCLGSEYFVIVVEDAGTFPGAVFPQTSACELADPVGQAAGARTSDPTFIAMWWDEAAIGSPSSFAFMAGTSSVYSDTFDLAPEEGVSRPVLHISGGSTPPTEPPPPAPTARSTASACTFDGGFEDGFDDVPSSNPHETAIDCIVYWKVTAGTTSDLYDPSGGVTRAQMASFLARFIERSGGTLPSDPPNAFSDDDGTTHEASIDKLAAVGIVGGRADGTYGADRALSRAQMATFMVRGLEFRLDGPVNDGAPVPNYFSDDDGDTHEANINKAASIGITGGTEGTAYGPEQRVRRDQMASFLARGLAELVDAGVASIPSPPGEAPPSEA